MDPRQRFKSDREEEHLDAQAARAGQREGEQCDGVQACEVSDGRLRRRL